MSECIYAIRGATTVDFDSVSAIDQAVKELFFTILDENGITEDEISFVLFSQTSDLRSRNAAAAVRKVGYCSSVPLFCVQEAEINGMLDKVIRVLVQVNHPRKKDPVMVYLNRAEKLRPDLKR